MFNKKGAGTAFTWLAGIIAIGLIILVFIFFNEVYTNDIIPIGQNIINSAPLLNASEKAVLLDQQNFHVTFWPFTIFILIAFVFLKMIISAVTKDKYGEE